MLYRAGFVKCLKSNGLTVLYEMVICRDGSGCPYIFLDKQYYAIYSIMRKEVWYGYSIETRLIGCMRPGGH